MPEPFSIKDLDDKLIGVQSNSSHHGWLQDNTSYKPILYPTVEDALLALAAGEIEIFIGNLAATSYQIEKLKIDNIRVAFQLPGGSQQLTFAVRNDWPELVSILNKALLAIPQEKKLDIRHKWIAFQLEGKQQKNLFISELTAPERQWLATHPEINLRIMSTWPPINFISRNGKPTGIGVDLANLLEKRTGLKFNIQPDHFSENLKAVKNKNADALMDVTPKPERAEYLDFTQPYLTIPHVIISRLNSPIYHNEKELRGKTIALEQGFGNVGYFQANYPEIEVVEYPDTISCLKAVADGKVDAYAGNRAVAGYLIARNVMTNLRITGALQKDGSVLTIGVRDDWPELTTILDKALSDLGAAEMQEILKRWVGFQGSDSPDAPHLELSAREMQFIAEHEPLTFSEVEWAPLSIVSDPEKFDGMIADYMNIISDRSGLKFRFAE